MRFADDQAMVSNSSQGLQRLMDGLNRAADEYCMRINVKKTKTIVTSKMEGKKVEIKVGQHQVEQVEQFKYLGSLFTEDGRCSKEIATTRLLLVQNSLARVIFSTAK